MNHITIYFDSSSSNFTVTELYNNDMILDTLAELAIVQAQRAQADLDVHMQV
jgi:hypothetical protein